MSAMHLIAAEKRTSREVRDVPILFSNSGFRCQALRDHPPGRDIFSRRTAGTLWSRYCSLRRKLLRPVELGSVHPHAGRIVDRGLEAERGDRADTSSFQSPRAMRDNSSVNRSCRAIAASIMPSVIANSSTPTDCSNLRPTSSIDWQLSKPSGSGSDAAISLAPRPRDDGRC